MEFQVGDYVTRKSYNSDIIFKIVKITSDRVILRSYKLRLMADAPIDDLLPYDLKSNKLKKKLQRESLNHLKRYQRNLILNSRSNTTNSFSKKEIRELTGKILHIDGDKDYLKLSLQNYHNLQLKVQGHFVPENCQPDKVLAYLKSFKPDILILTGHDGLENDGSHHTSNFFVEAVKMARKFNNDYDELIIFAGACQSNYFKLIEQGANFASSPDNKLLHFLDPVLIAEKIAYTSITEIISAKDLLKTTISENSVGGIETRGTMRLCFP